MLRFLGGAAAAHGAAYGHVVAARDRRRPSPAASLGKAAARRRAFSTLLKTRLRAAVPRRALPSLLSTVYCRVSAYKVPAGSILANKSRMFANCKAAVKFVGNPVAQKDGCVLVKQVRMQARLAAMLAACAPACSKQPAASRACALAAVLLTIHLLRACRAFSKSPTRPRGRHTASECRASSQQPRVHAWKCARRSSSTALF